MDAWGSEQEGEYNGLFAIRKSLDGEQSAEFVDKEQFIGIRIAKEEFLLTISVVNEIIMLPTITYLPNCPKFVEGVVNLRGTILPVINLRKMMGLPKGEVTSTTRIIICKDESVNFKVGLLVDAITFVVALLPDEIVKQSLPAGNAGADLISGIGKNGNKVMGIVDLGKILGVAADGKGLSEDETETTEKSA